MRATNIFIMATALALSATSAAFAGSTPPAGLRGTFDPRGKAFTLLWDDLSQAHVAGYNVYRRDSLTGSARKINTYTVPVSVYADRVDGRKFFYSVRSVFHDGTESADSAIVESTPDARVYAFAPDGGASVKLSAALARRLSAGGNSLGATLAVRFHDESARAEGASLRKVRIGLERLDTGTPVDDFDFGSEVVEISIRVNAVHGRALQGAFSAAETAAPSQTKDLSLYWHNGRRLIEVGGNGGNGALTVTTAGFGTFEVRPAGPSLAFGLQKENVYPRIVTPNGDGLNDRIFFRLDNPNNASVEGVVYDVTGREVASLRMPHSTTETQTTLVWEGRDDAGAAVPSGEYVYRLKGEGKSFTGLVAVAR